MVDNRTTVQVDELREAAVICNLAEERETAKLLREAAYTIESLRDRLQAATLGSERDEIYNAGFDNGVKACLQILDGYLDYPHSAVENISKWVDEQWKERES